MSLTSLGFRINEVLAGETVLMSESMMHRVGHDLSKMTPRRFVRAIPNRGGQFRVTMIGPPANGYETQRPL